VARNGTWYGALAGVAAAAVALGVAEVVAVGTGARSAPLVAVGGVVVDSVPESVKELAIQLFGVHDKTALFVGTSVLLAGFAALIGVAATRRRWLGYAGVAVFGAIGLAAAVTRHDAGVAAALPAVLGAVAGAGTLWLLLRWLPVDDAHRVVAEPVPADAGGSSAAAEQEPASPTIGTGGDRRTFLRGVAVAVGGAALFGFAGRALSSRANVRAARAGVTLPPPDSRSVGVPAGAELRLPGLTPYTTDNTRFYRIDTALVVPQVDPDEWSLRVHGRVRNPLTLTFADLLRRPSVERYVTLACVSNEVGGDLIGNARWQGVLLKDILDEADPEPGADQVVSRSVDGFTAGTPTAALRDGRDAMLAYAMNGEPLPIEHGFPVRMVVPGLYGYVSATKWLAELELRSFADFDAYWIERGWAAQAPIKTQSRIDTPRPRAALTGGQPVVVAGVAWAQQVGISTVEVRVDGGPWQPATLADTVSVDTWRQWSWRWEGATTGRHRLQVRATDNTGVPQTDVPAEPFPDGATGYHTVEVTVG
jgi:DMSO/TMAO reductase YedYZ molybdopterin-dependent catalytic subunit